MSAERSQEPECGSGAERFALPAFSVLIPTWKNLDFLDLAYRGLRKNSAVRHEVIIFFNEYDDRCKAWAEGKDVRVLRAGENVGVCKAVNEAAKIAGRDWICFMNDDMYPLPQWDTALWQYAGIAEKVWLSGTALEPGEAAECYIGEQDYGTTPADFRERELLNEFEKLKRPYNVVSTWTPTLLRKCDWEAVGGLDEMYFPGFGSDPDLAMKMYQHGCRHFVGVGTSLVYHFSRRSTSRFDDASFPDPRKLFKRKWGVSRRRFLKKILRRGSIINGVLPKYHGRATRLF